MYAEGALGRGLRDGEFEVVVEMSPADLEALGKDRGADIVKLIDGSRTCTHASREIAHKIMVEGSNINDPAVAILGLAALDRHFNGGGRDFIGAQTRAGVERRLDTLMQLGERHGKDMGSAWEPAASERQRGAGEAPTRHSGNGRARKRSPASPGPTS